MTELKPCTFCGHDPKMNNNVMPALDSGNIEE